MSFNLFDRSPTVAASSSMLIVDPLDFFERTRDLLEMRIQQGMNWYYPDRCFRLPETGESRWKESGNILDPTGKYRNNNRKMEAVFRSYVLGILPMTFRSCPATIHKQIFVFYKDTTGIRPEIVGIRQ